METNLITNEDLNIKDMIYEIRGKKVMFSSDLAKLYNVETKYLNRQVKRNIERFPEDYMFQISIEEYNSSRCQNVTLNKSNNKRGYNIKYLPFVFTEKGIYMLGNVLKSDKAIEISLYIINKFVELKNYYLSDGLLNQKYINNMVLEHDTKIEKLFNELEPKFKNRIFFSGQSYDAYSLLLDILESAKEEIIIIDNYTDKKILDLICKTNKKVIVISKNINEELIKKYQSQYDNLTIKYKDNIHDRFIIIDRNKLYHLGCSLKDLGNKCFGINLIQDKEYIDLLLNKK